MVKMVMESLTIFFVYFFLRCEKKVVTFRSVADRVINQQRRKREKRRKTWLSYAIWYSTGTCRMLRRRTSDFMRRLGYVFAAAVGRKLTEITIWYSVLVQRHLVCFGRVSFVHRGYAELFRWWRLSEHSQLSRCRTKPMWQVWFFFIFNWQQFDI